MYFLKTSSDNPPSDALLRLACDHLRRFVVTDEDSPPGVEWPADIDYIRQCLVAAISHCDGPYSSIRRALLPQEWAVFLDRFPPVIELPLSPVTAVTYIKYVDSAGNWQTLDPSRYRLSGAYCWAPEISPAHGDAWPATLPVPDCVEVAFAAGYDEEKIPPAIVQAVLELMAHFYAERQPVVFGNPYQLPMSVKALLAPYKVFR